MLRSSLTIVGTGIKFISHLTHEARVYIEKSELVLYLVNDPAMKHWIQRANVNSESLEYFYAQYTLRLECYNAITEYILEKVRNNISVCAVFYGHPGVFSRPGLEAVKKARAEGYDAKVLPGISAEACLFADLLIDPGTIGCQSFEATDFLIHDRKHDPSCHLILWQVDAIGILDHSLDYKPGIKCLLEVLERYYELDHEIILYEAAQYPGFDPLINKIYLRNLSEVNLSSTTTVYIPPAQLALCNKKILKKLKLNKNANE